MAKRGAKRPTTRRRVAGNDYARGVDAAAAMVPQNWCDPLLTGPRAVLRGHGPWGCPDIERLLNTLAAHIRALAAPSTVGSGRKVGPGRSPQGASGPRGAARRGDG